MFTYYYERICAIRIIILCIHFIRAAGAVSGKVLLLYTYSVMYAVVLIL